MRKLILPALFLALAVITSTASGRQGTAALPAWITAKVTLQTDNAGQPGDGTRGVRVTGSYYAGRPANSTQDNTVGKIVLNWEEWKKQIVPKGQPDKYAWEVTSFSKDELIPFVTGTSSGTYESLRYDIQLNDNSGNRIKYRANVLLYLVGKGQHDATSYDTYTFP